MNRLTTIDVHVAGEPLRIVTSGFPEPSGTTILEKRRTCQEQFDYLRQALMWEPRGHDDMYGCLLVKPSNPDADTGVLFFHNEGYSTMCGHGIIGLVTAMIENHLFPYSTPTTTIRFETPSGLVIANASVEEGNVRSVSFHNVESFAMELDQTITVPGVGVVSYDLAFGGAFYAFCQTEALGIDLHPKHAQQLKNLGMAVKQAIMADRPICHPSEQDLGFLYGTIFVSSSPTKQADYRQACIFADGSLDRSPTGTGVSAHLALLHAQGTILAGESRRFESILGTQFGGTIVEETRIASYPAIIPKVEGQAYITGKHEFFIDPDDPLRHGFLLK